MLTFLSIVDKHKDALDELMSFFDSDEAKKENGANVDADFEELMNNLVTSSKSRKRKSVDEKPPCGGW